MFRRRDNPLAFVSLLDTDKALASEDDEMDSSGMRAMSTVSSHQHRTGRGRSHGDVRAQRDTHHHVATDGRIESNSSALTAVAQHLHSHDSNDGLPSSLDVRDATRDEASEWTQVERELRLLRTGGTGLLIECELARAIGEDRIAREEAARAVARLRRFNGVGGAALSRDVQECVNHASTKAPCMHVHCDYTHTFACCPHTKEPTYSHPFSKR